MIRLSILAKWRQLPAGLSAFSLLCLSLSACGENATFTGVNRDGIPLLEETGILPDQEESVEPSPNNSPEESEAIGKESITTDGATPATVDIPISTNLYWLWPCNGQTLEVPTTGVTIEGTGEFQLDIKDHIEINLMITGGYCEPDSADRDVIFAVDVSSSMGGVFGNDPKKKNSCGRMEAIKAVVDTLTPTDRVGLVTFNSSVKTSIPLQSVDEFKANEKFSVQTLCAGSGSTSFKAALVETQKILIDARPQSFQEIYFLSDGENDSGAEEAALIRQQATIATIGLKGSDNQLKDKIASKDSNGEPMHRKVAGAGDLAAAFKDLAVSKLLSGSMAIGHLGGDPEDIYEIDPTTGSLFTIPVITITRDQYPTGLAFDLEYTDDRGRVYGGLGSITWK